ncbi:hypothetical protein MTO96_020621 [Rhipicephalus appendiculatus]
MAHRGVSAFEQTHARGAAADVAKRVDTFQWRVQCRARRAPPKRRERAKLARAQITAVHYFRLPRRACSIQMDHLLMVYRSFAPRLITSSRITEHPRVSTLPRGAAAVTTSFLSICLR